MFKFIIFSIIAFYLLIKVIGFLFRVLIKVSGSAATRSYSNGNFSQNGYSKRAANSDINIDYVPGEKGKREFKGGEYVDYEEIK